jgi:predicted nucleic acid-binding protein
LIYLDSSALVKLVTPEAETAALRQFLSDHSDQPAITAALARLEVVRAVRHAGPDAIDDARELLDRVAQVALSEELLDDAADLGDQVLRSLDAIHLAAALTLGPALTAFVAYDKRLNQAAGEQGLALATPA